MRGLISLALILFVALSAQASAKTIIKCTAEQIRGLPSGEVKSGYWGDQFISKISNSKMGLNLSRGEPIKHYSSDRLAQLIGNGLLTFIDKKTCYDDFFSEKEMIFYTNLNDLTEKIQKYKKNNHESEKIAKNGKKKYFKYFNSNIVSQFIINKTFEFKTTKTYWEK